MNIEQIIEAVKGMTVLELNDLVKKCEEEFGVSASAQIVVSGEGSSDSKVEQTEFDVILASYGDKKINVIKIVRELTGLGLKEAKELVDGVPKPLKEAISKDEAETIKSKLEEAGAKVEIK